MKKLIFLLLFLGITFNAWAATYYVKTGGSDAADGLSDANAWATIAKVNSDLPSGATCAFAADSVWREQLVPVSGTAGHYTTYTSYGTGAKPLLLGSVQRNNLSDWTDLGGNIWQTGIIDAATIGSELLSNPSFETSTYGWTLYANAGAGADTTGSGRTTTAGEFDSGSAGYKLVCVNNGANASDIQLFFASVSITSGEWYKLTFKAKATSGFNVGIIPLMKSSSPFSNYYSIVSSTGISITTDWVTYTIYYKTNITATDGRINWALGNLIPDGETMYLDTVSFMNCENPGLLNVDVGNLIFDNEASCGVKVQAEVSLDTQDKFWYDFTNDLIKVYSVGNPASVHSDIECALYQHGISGAKSYVVIEDLDFRYWGAHGIDSGVSAYGIIRNCNFSFIGGADQFNNYTVRFGNGIEFWNGAHDLLVERNTLSNIYDAALTAQGNGTFSKYNIIFQNNIIDKSEYLIELWHRDDTSTVDNIQVIHNTCTNAGSGWGHTQRWDEVNGRHLILYTNTATMISKYVIKNNIFDTATESGVWIQSAADNADFDINHNCWNVVTLGRMSSTNYTTLAAWQSATSQDLNSIATDPLLNADYTLQSASPCIDAGEDVGALYDYASRARTNEPDIGAHEQESNIAGGMFGGIKGSIKK